MPFTDSMNTTPTPDSPSHGKILDHDAGTGEIANDEIEARARELSMIAGRLPDQFNETDRKQAVEELRGGRDQMEANDEMPLAAEMTERDELTGGLASPATDVSDGDQSIGETLYNEALFQKTGCAASAFRLSRLHIVKRGRPCQTTFLPSSRVQSPAPRPPPYSESVPR